MDNFFGGAGLLRTKDGLKEEDYELTREVHQLQSSYKKMYDPVRELSEIYTDCKEDMVFLRYKSLKDMIKNCLNAYEEQKKVLEKNSGSKDKLKGAGAFLDLATETRAVIAEVEPLRKAELVQDIEEKKIKKERLKGKFQLLENSIERLRTDYTSSKEESPGTRYKLMKSMIKQLIRTQNILPEKQKK